MFLSSFCRKLSQQAPGSYFQIKTFTFSAQRQNAWIGKAMVKGSNAGISKEWQQLKRVDYENAVIGSGQFGCWI